MSHSPGGDFYSYVNDEWQHRVHMPNYENSYNISDEVEDTVNRHLLACIESHTRTHPEHPLSVVVNSVIHNGRNNTDDLLSQLAMFSTDTEIGYAIGYLNSLQCSSPIDIAIRSNCHGHCCVYIGEPSLGLPGKHNFTDPETVAKYKTYLSTVGRLLHLPHFDKVYDIEKPFVAAIFDGKGDEEKTYTFDALAAKYKHIPWAAILTGFGFDTPLYTRIEYRITNTDYIRKLNKDYTSIHHEAWTRWLQSMFIHSFIEYLPAPYSNLHFELYSHFIKGTPRKLPRSMYLLRILNNYVPQLLGSVCIGKICSDDTKRRATDMVHRLKESTQHRIEEAVWLHSRTRRKALEKVAAMLFQVAYPAHWKIETEGITLYKDRLLTNLLSIGSRETVRHIAQLRADDCGRKPSIWDDSPFIVNAYYYTDRNMLTITAGSLRPPFFDARRSLAWNLGGIGVVIGHEISHGFDDDGRLHDKEGERTNWWFPRDERMYHIYTQKIVKLFDGVSYAGGIVNGKRTLDENIADLCGISIALGALNTALAAESKVDRLRAYRDFFTSYATSWRTKDRPKKALFSLRTSVHAPAKLRVNLIVKQFDEFYEAFNIREGDLGWIEPSKRIRIW